MFADIFNFYIYGGRQVILPEQLTERDSTKIALPYGADEMGLDTEKIAQVVGYAVETVKGWLGLES